MEYQIIEKSWSKRRKLDSAKIITNISLIDFIKQHNHFCKMQVSYGDGSEQTLTARVIFNALKQQWTVDGMHVAIRLVDEGGGI